MSTSAKTKEQQLDLVFQALANSKRRIVLQKLSKGSATIKQLGESFDISKAGMGKHIRVLEEAKLIARTDDGRIHRCNLNPKTLQDVDKWLKTYRHFWSDALSQLDRYARSLK